MLHAIDNIGDIMKHKAIKSEIKEYSQNERGNKVLQNQNRRTFFSLLGVTVTSGLIISLNPFKLFNGNNNKNDKIMIEIHPSAIRRVKKEVV